METSVPDIPGLTGLTRGLVHDGLEAFLQPIVRPRRVEPLLEQLQGTFRSNMTTRLMGPLEECRMWSLGTTIRSSCQNVGLVPLPLLLVDQGGFQTLLQAFVDAPKVFQVLRFLESI